MHLGSGRCCESDKDDDVITAQIRVDGADEKIGFPVINGPNVAGLTYDHGRSDASLE